VLQKKKQELEGAYKDFFNSSRFNSFLTKTKFTRDTLPKELNEQLKEFFVNSGGVEDLFNLILP
jgi:hypothetical protein